jgi:hypothetical protein
MEWGTNIRGRYELTCPPELIVMRWDFEDDNVPVPGGELPAYLRIRPHGGGAHVEVHQLVETQAQAAFMEGAWAMVLGRLEANVTRALDPAAPCPRAPPAQAHHPLSLHFHDHGSFGTNSAQKDHDHEIAGLPAQSRAPRQASRSARRGGPG